MTFLDQHHERKSLDDHKKNAERSFDTPVYTTGIAAKILGITPHTLRLYEKEGLILSHKTETGRHLFSDMELEKVKSIRTMVRNEGFTFESVRRLLGMVPCWKIRSCDSEDCENCQARNTPHTPCWASGVPCSSPLSSCRECSVYKNLITSDDIYSFINA